MWIAKSVTSERPGNGATAWQLTVKRGGMSDDEKD
jgi:hypothetical protein